MSAQFNYVAEYKPFYNLDHFPIECVQPLNQLQEYIPLADLDIPDADSQYSGIKSVVQM